MKLTLSFLLTTLVSLSVFARSGDPEIQMSSNPRAMGGSVQQIMDGSLINGTYQDDGQTRSDKMYYGVDFSFDSTYKKSDVDFILNPGNSRLPQLFKDPMSIKRSGGRFSLATSFGIPLIKTFHMNGLMDYSVRNAGDTTIHTFSTHTYNMFLYQNRIRVEVRDVNGITKIRVIQVAAVKGSAQKKLDSYGLAGTFKGRVLANVRKMASGLGKQ